MRSFYDLLKTPKFYVVNLSKTDDTVVWQDPDIWKIQENFVKLKN